MRNWRILFVFGIMLVGFVSLLWRDPAKTPRESVTTSVQTPVQMAVVDRVPDIEMPTLTMPDGASYEMPPFPGGVRGDRGLVSRRLGYLMGNNPVPSARALFDAVNRGDVLMLGVSVRTSVFGFDKWPGSEITAYQGTDRASGEYWILTFDPVLIAQIDNATQAVDLMASFAHESVHYKQSLRSPDLFSVGYEQTCDESWELEREAYSVHCITARSWNLIQGEMAECHTGKWTWAGMQSTGQVNRARPECVARWQELSAIP